ncbi:MAG: 5-formyltetrahydrofolate cyclo-ligase [Rickettsiales bacterium]
MTVSKEDLRKELLAKRQSIKQEEAKSASVAIAGFLSDIIPQASIVSGYQAIRGEVNLDDLLDELKDRGVKVTLPVVSDNSQILRFLEYSEKQELIIGKFRVLQPKDSAKELAPDIVICPMVGFDGNGNRLGYGGGYYDTTIKELRKENKNLLVVGVAYEAQRIDSIAIHNGDESMDIVVTEKKVLKFA